MFYVIYCYLKLTHSQRSLLHDILQELLLQANLVDILSNLLKKCAILTVLPVGLKIVK